MSNSTPTIHIVSIHDMDPRGFLSFDLVQILERLRDLVQDYQWVAGELECTGEAIPTGRILSFDQLVTFARCAEQTIDGSIVGVRPGYFEKTEWERITRVRDFPWTPARVAIVAVDSSYFEVLAKESPPIDRIWQTFRNVRNEDPVSYFGMEAGGA